MIAVFDAVAQGVLIVLLISVGVSAAAITCIFLKHLFNREDGEK
jgi:hypothetical protein